MICSNTPSRIQVWNQRCTVLLEPYFSGRSFHFAPLSSIQKIPRSTLRGSAGGRPPWGPGTGLGIRSTSQSSCSSVSLGMPYYTEKLSVRGFGIGSSRPNVLLMDEPELCLHPNAIRDACRVLYDLPSAGNWQAMITTHSPVFIDLSRNNTSIARVERDGAGQVKGTTI